MNVTRDCIEVFWDDLNQEAKNILIDVYGDNQNWDFIPLATIPYPEEDSDDISDSK